MTTTLKARSKPTLFPRTDVESLLRNGLDEVVSTQAMMAGDDGKAGSQDIDSLSAVELLCQIDEIVGFEVKQSVVKAGGYRSVQAALDHMLPGIERAWSKRFGGGK